MKKNFRLLIMMALRKWRLEEILAYKQKLSIFNNYYLNIMLLEAVMFLPPYSVMAQFGLLFTPHCFLHSAAYCFKFQGRGSNISFTPSEHMGMTISVQAW